MLPVPENGLRRSITKHNSDLDIACDWVESSVVFDDERISKTDVVDLLLENGFYDSQDFATQFVDDVWSVLRVRAERIGDVSGLSVNGRRIKRTLEWRDFPAYAFCLAISCAPMYAALRENADPVNQGALFEEFSENALKGVFPGWTINRVGWSPDNTQRLGEIIDDLTLNLREVAGAERDIHLTNYTNELGLDIIAFRPFQDSHASIPVLMFQCASGLDWKSKRKTPDLDIWRKVISFTSSPIRAMTIPYAFADARDFRRETTPINGICAERYRLLDGFKRVDDSQAIQQLNERLAAWVTQRLALFLGAN